MEATRTAHKLELNYRPGAIDDINDAQTPMMLSDMLSELALQRVRFAMLVCQEVDIGSPDKVKGLLCDAELLISASRGALTGERYEIDPSVIPGGLKNLCEHANQLREALGRLDSPLLESDREALVDMAHGLFLALGDLAEKREGAEA